MERVDSYFQANNITKDFIIRGILLAYRESLFHSLQRTSASPTDLKTVKYAIKFESQETHLESTPTIVFRCTFNPSIRLDGESIDYSSHSRKHVEHCQYRSDLD